MMSLKPEPVSALFLPVKIEQHIPFPLRLEVDVKSSDIVLYVFICFKNISSFSFKYSAKVNKVLLSATFLHFFYTNFENNLQVLHL
jgi:hypothetical protein